ncbi:FTR1 family iron permease [Paenibacillus pinistramenti]|uniref:FTR1 family iron permease n=1 Tax=Paenibacillus pinistramenti TaxID=1768003 RepID=UPI001EF0D573|nr:FTR1 family protein [Paenibacillus pinistramenti]
MTQPNRNSEHGHGKFSRLGRCLLPAALAFSVALSGAGAGTAWVSAVSAAGEQEQPALEDLLPLVGGSLAAAGSEDWAEAASELDQFTAAWSGLAVPGDTDSRIQTELAAADSAISSKDKEAASQALSALAKDVNSYVEAAGSGASESGGGASGSATTDAGKEAANTLLGMSRKAAEDLQQSNIEAAKQDFKAVTDGWTKLESPIRQAHFGLYSKLETKMSLIRVALQAEPAKAGQAASQLADMNALLQEYLDGKLDGQQDAAPADGSVSLSDAVALLHSTSSLMASGDLAGAQEKLNQFIEMWPSVEGEVSISSSSAYQNTENRMTEALGYLTSDPPAADKAQSVVQSMLNELEPISSVTSYSAWDAALIMLREGLEAILVVTALLAFAKRAGNRPARRFIWSGAAAGLVLSGLFAVVLTYAVSRAASGGARELTEGITGLAAVVMMLTVGAWLHGKASTAAWNRYISRQVGGALARGSLWSLFALSGLAILREGAETAVFYIGMASSITPAQLILGIGGALVGLVLLGYAMIRFSSKLPVGAFFLTATAFIYYLVLRFLGESIHALQIAGRLPAHNQSGLPSLSWLGCYPTWETFVPQVLLLLYILATFGFRSYSSRHSKAEDKRPATGPNALQ